MLEEESKIVIVLRGWQSLIRDEKDCRDGISKICCQQAILPTETAQLHRIDAFWWSADTISSHLKRRVNDYLFNEITVKIDLCDNSRYRWSTSVGKGMPSKGLVTKCTSQLRPNSKCRLNIWNTRHDANGPRRLKNVESIHESNCCKLSI